MEKFSWVTLLSIWYLVVFGKHPCLTQMRYKLRFTVGFICNLLHIYPTHKINYIFPLPKPYL
ncbi:hypothetical protein Hdeb2414_s0008g00285201 [Helianthus debilis subsp. tardiflorus]